MNLEMRDGQAGSPKQTIPDLGAGNLHPGVGFALTGPAPFILTPNEKVYRARMGIGGIGVK